MKDIDRLRRAYAFLSSLKQNLPQTIHPVHERYVREYHTIIDDLKQLGFDLEQFRIPEPELKHKAVSIDMMTGRDEYSKDRYVEKAFLLVKLDALLGYFTLVIDDKKPAIGFKS